ncbi:2-C-methyl-D-erythritol 4-phosphate cytidylyltransferase [Spirochaetia bacterium]|nr:2-C-methyl-D-erythritol 4-phosphate cytidylyltransferase [Spirochaetia bacterium]
MNPRIAAIITAAGSSSRMGGVKKEYRPLPDQFDDEGKPLTVLGAAVQTFVAVPRIGLIVISVPATGEYGEAAARAALPKRCQTPIRFVPGGPTRRSSVHNALTFLEDYNPGYVLIHDGARPWVDRDLIERTIDAAIAHRAAVPLLPLTETPKEIDDSGFVKRHLKRAQIGAAQTPQGFAYPDILRAHEQAALREASGVDYTDDAEVWGEFQGAVAVISGSPANRKITFPEDMV